MNQLKKLPYHLILAFQQPKHPQVLPIINMVIEELQQQKSIKFLTLYDQNGEITKKNQIINNLNIKYEDQQYFENKLFQCYQQHQTIQEAFFNNDPAYYIPQIIILSNKQQLFGLPFEYLKGGEIFFYKIENFNKNTLFKQLFLVISAFQKYSQAEQREGK